MQCIIMENTLIKLTHHDETKKRAHDSQIVRAKENLKSLDLQCNFGLLSLPRLNTIHSSFILYHNPDARCLPKNSQGRRQYHKIVR